MPSIATNTKVGREELLDLARDRHRYALVDCFRFPARLSDDA
jgi:hypothetical protein